MYFSVTSTVGYTYKCIADPDAIKSNPHTAWKLRLPLRCVNISNWRQHRKDGSGGIERQQGTGLPSRTYLVEPAGNHSPSSSAPVQVRVGLSKTLVCPSAVRSYVYIRNLLSNKKPRYDVYSRPKVQGTRLESPSQIWAKHPAHTPSTEYTHPPNLCPSDAN